MRLTLLSALLLPVLAAPLAHADTTYDLSVSSFSINEGNTPFANVTGTVSGSLSGNFVAVAPTPVNQSPLTYADVTVSWDQGGVTNSETLDLADVTSQLYFQGNQSHIQFGDNGVSLALFFDQNNDGSFSLQSGSFVIVPVEGIPEANLSGSLTPAAVAATPEPSSLVLLGTGLLGAAGAARRRFMSA